MHRTRPNNAIYVSPSSPKSIAEHLEKEGIALDKIESTIGCSIEDLSTIDYRVPIQNYHALWDLAIESTSEPAIGLAIGSQVHKDDMGLLGHIFFNCATLGEALLQYERYYSVINEGMHVEVIESDDLVHLNYCCDDVDAYHIADMERTLAVSVTRARQWISKNLKIEYVGFQHPRPKHVQRYEDVFPCPVYFEQTNSCLVFQRRFLQFRLPNRSSYLYKVLIKHVDGILGRINPRRPISQRVRKLVRSRLARDGVESEKIANKLNMSRNTLYRRLKHEGTSFHDLVDEVRKDQAQRYLIEGKHNLSEIAFLLGFSELSAFSRAFKRWHGCAPGNYLNSLKNDE